MGCYVNPPDKSKESWLEENAMELPTLPSANDITPETIPVCLVDNGPFTAAAVAYCESELAVFQNPADTRPKRWFLADVEDLKAVSPLAEYMGLPG